VTLILEVNRGLTAFKLTQKYFQIFSINIAPLSQAKMSCVTDFQDGHCTLSDIRQRCVHMYIYIFSFQKKKPNTNTLNHQISLPFNGT